MPEFKLINPIIAGTFPDTYTSDTSENAASEFWNQLTGGKYITGELPKFYFTLKNTKNNSLSHFKVEEKRKGSDASFTISSLSGSGIGPSNTDEKNFLVKANEIINSLQSQDGGKRKRKYDDSSSSSSSDDDDDLLRYIRRRQVVRPLAYWWYAPYLYKTDVLYTPTFVAPISPYVQLYLPL
jgi:hypothetical protein